jgi:hypothetical protein
MYLHSPKCLHRVYRTVVPLPCKSWLSLYNTYIAPLEEQCHNSKNAHFELCPQEACLRPYLPSGTASHVYFLKWPREGRSDVVLFYYYYLTAIGLTPGGSSTVHIYTQTAHRIQRTEHTWQKKKKIGKWGPCPVFASYTLAFASQLRKKHGKASIRVVEKCPDIPVAVVQYTFTHKQYTEQHN